MGPTVTEGWRGPQTPLERLDRRQRSWPRTFPWRQEHQPGWPLNGVRLFAAVWFRSR